MYIQYIKGTLWSFCVCVTAVFFPSGLLPVCNVSLRIIAASCWKSETPWKRCVSHHLCAHLRVSLQLLQTKTGAHSKQRCSIGVLVVKTTQGTFKLILVWYIYMCTYIHTGIIFPEDKPKSTNITSTAHIVQHWCMNKHGPDSVTQH